MAFQKLRAYMGRVKLGWAVVGRAGVMMGQFVEGMNWYRRILCRRVL